MYFTIFRECDLFSFRVLKSLLSLSSQRQAMGISRDNWHKRRKTGGKLGCPAANTKIGPLRIHTVHVRGGNKKYRALRLDVGNFSWGSECEWSPAGVGGNSAPNPCFQASVSAFSRKSMAWTKILKFSCWTPLRLWRLISNTVLPLNSNSLRDWGWIWRLGGCQPRLER